MIKKIKQIKAWAIVNVKGELIGSWDYGGYEIYHTRKEAKDINLDDNGVECPVVPVLISFPQRSSKKIK